MNEIEKLLQEGKVVIAKQGDPATPEQLGEAILEYCEAAGYTIEELFRTEMALDRVIRNNTRKCQEETKISVIAESRG